MSDYYQPAESSLVRGRIPFNKNLKNKMIKKRIRLGFLVFAFLSLIFVGVNSANAQAISLTADTTISIDSANYTASSGGAATSFIVDALTLTVTVPASSTFTLVSADRYKLNNDQSVSQQCSASQNSITLAGPLTSIVITPDKTTVCAYSSGGGSTGGGGGSAPADTVPPTNTAISINAGATSTTSSNVTLTLTATGASDVMVSNVASFYNGVWVPYISSMPWTVLAGDGVKTVYAKFRDTAGNVSAAVQDTIGIGVSVPTITATPATPGEIPGCGARTTGFSSSTGAS